MQEADEGDEGDAGGVGDLGDAGDEDANMPRSLRGDRGETWAARRAAQAALPRAYCTTGTSRQFNSRRLRLEDSDTFRLSTVPVLEPTDSVVPPLVLLVKRRSVTA